MKVCGIIAEFNPFHNGHKFIIEKAKQDTNCDYLIIVTSGDFVQRGEPAIINKFDRTRMALTEGADAVFMMPVQMSTASAQYFARCGVSMLSNLGADYLFFGSESGDLSLLASSSYELGQITPPNDILGREYIAAIKHLNSPLKAFTTSRLGASYNNSSTIVDNLCSASYLRRALKDKASISNAPIPPSCLALLDAALQAGGLVFLDDLSDILFSRLIASSHGGYQGFFDVFGDLSDKIKGHITEYTGFTSFIESLKSKDITYSHLSRALLHIALGIDDTQIQYIKEYNYAPYARLLGFRKDSKALISYINAHSSIPVISKPSKFISIADDKQAAIFSADINASHIYSYLESKKTAPFTHEYAQPLIII